MDKVCIWILRTEQPQKLPICKELTFFALVYLQGIQAIQLVEQCRLAATLQELVRQVQDDL